MEKSLVLGGGCFWCLEAVFQRLKGVNKITSGYAGGHIKNPCYREVCNGTTGHAEVIKIDYDESIISLSILLEIFFTHHDPTTLNRQGADVGTQYRSIIFYENNDEKKIIEDFIANVASQYHDNPIVTEVSESATFYNAEENHQNYFNDHRSASYCQIVIDPKVQKLIKNYAKLLKDEA